MCWWGAVLVRAYLCYINLSQLVVYFKIWTSPSDNCDQLSPAIPSFYCFHNRNGPLRVYSRIYDLYLFIVKDASSHRQTRAWLRSSLSCWRPQRGCRTGSLTEAWEGRRNMLTNHAFTPSLAWCSICSGIRIHFTKLVWTRHFGEYVLPCSYDKFSLSMEEYGRDPGLYKL